MNLKEKISLAIAALMLVVFGVGVVIQDYLIQTSLKRIVAEQQFSLVARIADEIDNRFRLQFDALNRIAAGITPELLADRARLQAYLDDKPGVLSLFDDLVVLSPALLVLADNPVFPGRQGAGVAHFEHLRRVAQTLEPAVSTPFVGKVTQRPSLAQAVPVRDGKGRLIAILSGQMNLLDPGFLGSLSTRKVGQSGHFVLTTRERTTIVSRFPERLLHPNAAPGANPVYDRALAGWEGTQEGTTSYGEAVLMSFRSLHTADWVLGALRPVEEAYAPISASRRTALWLLLGASLLVGLVVWLMMRSLFNPLLALRENARRLRSEPELAATLGTGSDEIGEVAADFYRLVGELSQSRRDSVTRAEELQSILDASPVSIALIRKRCLMSANHTFERMFGWRVDEVRGQSVEQFYPSREAFEAFGRRLYPAIADGRVATFEQLFRDRGGRVFWSNFYARLLDPQNPEKGAVVLIEDISERKAAEAARAESEARIRHLAEHDALTNLPNRVLLGDRLAQAIVVAQREGRQMALMFVDLDRFKNINDSLGHEVGDGLLRIVAERIQSCVRASDTVSRPGGDEFILLLPEITHPGDAARVAEKLLAALARPCQVGEHELRVTASVGISVYPDDGGDPATLIRNADTAMYHSKEGGRNTCHFFRPEMNARVFERMSLENSLRRALERGELLLHYQPQIDIASRRIVGVEALVRWQHPELGLVPPARFIPVAEDSGLILALGAWVLAEACRQNRAWQAGGLPALPVAVNISALQFRQTHFVEAIEAALTLSGLAPEWLELELTESVMMHAAERNIEVLEAIRRMGVKVAIDDFGTGYSSLAYLKRLPIDRLKIDQAFVRDVATNADDAAIIAAIIGLAHNMKLRVIAEGVESEAQFDFLQRGGCAEAQGYLFSRPLPADAFERYWRAALAT